MLIDALTFYIRGGAVATSQRTIVSALDVFVGRSRYRDRQKPASCR